MDNPLSDLNLENPEEMLDNLEESTPNQQNTDDDFLGEAPKRKALDKFHKSSKRSSFDNKNRGVQNQDEPLEEDQIDEDDIIESENNIPTSEEKKEKSKTNTFFERVVFILLCMFFIWFTVTTIRTGNNTTDASNPMNSVRKYLRNFSDNVDKSEERLDTLFEYEKGGD